MNMIKLIESVYSFLWGDLFLFQIGGSTIGIPLLVSSDTGRYLFHDSDKMPSDSAFSRYDSSVRREKQRKKQFVILADPGGVYCNKSRDGKSGGSSSGHIGRRRRCSFLDVGHSHSGLIDSIY